MSCGLVPRPGPGRCRFGDRPGDRTGATAGAGTAAGAEPGGPFARTGHAARRRATGRRRGASRASATRREVPQPGRDLGGPAGRCRGRSGLARAAARRQEVAARRGRPSRQSGGGAAGRRRRMAVTGPVPTGRGEARSGRRRAGRRGGDGQTPGERRRRGERGAGASAGARGERRRQGEADAGASADAGAGADAGGARAGRARSALRPGGARRRHRRRQRPPRCRGRTCARPPLGYPAGRGTRPGMADEEHGGEENITVQVTIGRVEVRAAPPAPAERSASSPAAGPSWPITSGRGRVRRERRHEQCPRHRRGHRHAAESAAGRHPALGAGGAGHGAAPGPARENMTVDSVNLFLYNTGPDAAWRNADLPGVHPGEPAKPPLALTLSYLVTSYSQADDDTVSHRLLGGAMSALNQAPLLDPDGHPGRAPRQRPIPAGRAGQGDPRNRSTSKRSPSCGRRSRPTTGSPPRTSVSAVLIQNPVGAATPLPVLSMGPGGHRDRLAQPSAAVPGRAALGRAGRRPAVRPARRRDRADRR